MFIFLVFIYFFSSSSSQSQQTSLLNENPYRSIPGHQDRTEYETKNSMSESDIREHCALKRDLKRPTNQLYKSLNAIEFLAKTQSEIRQEFRKMPNPPAKDTHAAK